jgi:hypothetical protein
MTPAAHTAIPTPWAKRPSGAEPDATLYAIQRGLTVSLIATPRDRFETCVEHERLSKVVERNRHNGFDFLPVIERNNGLIIGLIEISAFIRANSIAESTVSDLMHPLSEEHLFGAEASILTFVRDADRRRFNFVVSHHQISGLISLSDLQQLPVRAVIFGLVTYLEVVMADVIFGGEMYWLKRVSKGRRRKLEREIAKAQQADNLVDPLLLTHFSDKVEVILENGACKIGRDQVDRDFKQIRRLCNHLAHANDYAASAETAADTCRTVRLIDQWIDEFSGWLSASALAAPGPLPFTPAGQWKGQ